MVPQYYTGQHNLSCVCTWVLPCSLQQSNNEVLNLKSDEDFMYCTKKVEDELRVLREIGCSYEPKQSSNFTSKQEDNWVRAPGMPAWNDCFPCIFYDNCWGQKDSSFCLPSLKRYEIIILIYNNECLDIYQTLHVACVTLLPTYPKWWSSLLLPGHFYDVDFTCIRCESGALWVVWSVDHVMS